ncbi:MAG: hypothetical protein ACJAQT_003060 [Akkermansiaceae bacterium]|jgi:hypothetical protein
MSEVKFTRKGNCSKEHFLGILIGFKAFDTLCGSTEKLEKSSRWN